MSPDRSVPLRYVPVLPSLLLLAGRSAASAARRGCSSEMGEGSTGCLRGRADWNSRQDPVPDISKRGIGRGGDQTFSGERSVSRQNQPPITHLGCGLRLRSVSEDASYGGISERSGCRSFLGKEHCVCRRASNSEGLAGGEAPQTFEMVTSCEGQCIIDEELWDNK